MALLKNALFLILSLEVGSVSLAYAANQWQQYPSPPSHTTVNPRPAIHIRPTTTVRPAQIIRPGFVAQPQTNFNQTHQLTPQPNAINLNRPGPNTINLNHSNSNSQNGNNFHQQNFQNNNGHRHNFNVPYVLYYGSGLYPYYPSYTGFIPYDDSEFTTSDDYDDTPSEPIADINNSISTVNQSIPNGNWLYASDGNVPNGAIVYQTDANGNNSYYCHTNYNGVDYYGVLIAGDGCYSQDGSTTVRFTDYEVLVPN